MSIFNKSQRYKIQTGPDGVHWASLEPLAADIREQMDLPDVQEKPEVLSSLRIVQAFVDSLIMEGRANDYHQKDDDDELPYRETLN